MKRPIISALLFLSIGNLFALTPREEIAADPLKAGGIYLAYPESEISPVASEVPKGYEPFYISHYGRHGSRYLISDRDYSRILETLQKAADAGALSEKGLEVLALVDSAWQEGRGRGGELTPLGSRQHRGIARRAAQAFPKVFAPGAEVTAASTPVMRCAHSMFGFIEGLKELNPHLQIPRESAERNLFYLNYHSPESGPYSSKEGPWYQDYRRFRAEKTTPERMMGTLFSDNEYLNRWVDQDELMWGLYWLAVDMQNMETPVSFIELFTNDELYGLWEAANFNFYACNSSYPLANGEHTANARNLVNHIIENADSYVSGGKHGATLRFGHDGNIIPLVALMKIEGTYSDAIAPEDLAAGGYATYRISPMASNLQLIFFRSKKNPEDIAVRVLLNEKPAEIKDVPRIGEALYRWNDLREYLRGL